MTGEAIVGWWQQVFLKMREFSGCVERMNEGETKTDLFIAGVYYHLLVFTGYFTGLHNMPQLDNWTLDLIWQSIFIWLHCCSGFRMLA